MRQVLIVAGLLAVFSVGAQGQDTAGNNINTAVPIYFGQNVTDIIDSATKPWMVYSLTLDRGQTISVTGSITVDPNWNICLLSPSATTVSNMAGRNCANDHPNTLKASGYRFRGLSFEYQVAAAGKYYLMVQTFTPTTAFEMQVKAVGTPLLTALPASAGCLSGKVDSILYSLQLIAAGLPDEVTIGGQRACRGCTVKPPLYTEIANRLESALRSGVSVEACYDSAGSIFQLKLLRQ